MHNARNEHVERIPGRSIDEPEIFCGVRPARFLGSEAIWAGIFDEGRRAVKRIIPRPVDVVPLLVFRPCSPR